jgi:hypothetical protein
VLDQIGYEPIDKFVVSRSEALLKNAKSTSSSSPDNAKALRQPEQRLRSRS